MLRYGFHRDIPVLSGSRADLSFCSWSFSGLRPHCAAGSHVSVEILAAIAPRRIAQFMYDIVVPLISMIFVGTVMVAGAIMVQRYFVSGRMTLGSMPMPFWILIAIVPVGCVAMELSLLSQLIDGVRNWRRPGRQTSSE